SLLLPNPSPRRQIRPPWCLQENLQFGRWSPCSSSHRPQSPSGSAPVRFVSLEFSGRLPSPILLALILMAFFTPMGFACFSCFATVLGGNLLKCLPPAAKFSPSPPHFPTLKCSAFLRTAHNSLSVHLILAFAPFLFGSCPPSVEPLAAWENSSPTTPSSLATVLELPIRRQKASSKSASMAVTLTCCQKWLGSNGVSFGRPMVLVSGFIGSTHPGLPGVYGKSAPMEQTFIKFFLIGPEGRLSAAVNGPPMEDTSSLSRTVKNLLVIFGPFASRTVSSAVKNHLSACPPTPCLFRCFFLPATAKRFIFLATN